MRAAQGGLAVSVFEASRSGGGRARAVPLPLPDGREVMADNGQHILIGAYSETLRLMRLVGAEPQRLLLRLPLALAYPMARGWRCPPPAGCPRRWTPPGALPARAAGPGARGWRCCAGRWPGSAAALPAARRRAWPICAVACLGSCCAISSSRFASRP